MDIRGILPLRAGLAVACFILTVEVQAHESGVPRTATLRGTLEIAIEDRLDGSEARIAAVRTPQGVIPIDADALPEHAVSGGEAQVSVTKTRRGRTVSGVSVSDRSPLLRDRPERIAILLLRFTQAGQPIGPGISPEEARGLILEEGARYLHEVSHGKLRLDGLVAGTYTLHFEPTCDYARIREAAIALADPDLDFREFTRIALLYPDNGCSSSGRGTIGKPIFQTGDGDARASVLWLNGTFNLKLFAHEFGHNLGLQHASALLCGRSDSVPEGCRDVEYGDPYDAMGSAFPGHYNFSSQRRLGWIAGSQVRRVDTSTPHVKRYRLSPLELGEGLLGLEVPVTLSNGQASAYLIEYRQPLGFDAEQPRGTDGALVRITMTSEHQGSAYRHTHLLSPPGPMPRAKDGLKDLFLLPVGGGYDDSRSGIAIRVIRRWPDFLEVEVAVGVPGEERPSRFDITVRYSREMAGFAIGVGGPVAETLSRLPREQRTELLELAEVRADEVFEKLRWVRPAEGRPGRDNFNSAYLEAALGAYSTLASALERQGLADDALAAQLGELEQAVRAQADAQ